MSQAPQYRIYWQPGCSSCLKAKEYLTQRGIAFDSINVHAEPDGLAELKALGARSVPVVARGTAYVAAQDLDELARFLGVAEQRAKLPIHELAEKLELVMAANDRYLAQLPDDLAQHRLRQDRTVLDVAYHVFVIVTAFLDAVRGGVLTEDYFSRTTAPGMTAADVRQFGADVRKDFGSWWRGAASGDAPDSVATYYGTHAMPAFFERTCWHAAQHCRQVMWVLEKNAVRPDGPLGDAELKGLPLPEHIWDDQVTL